MSASDPFLASILKDRYQLRRQLSKKAGRRTLLAFDKQSQQPVIIKLLTFSQDSAWEEIRLFQREAELLQTLSHPSIPKYIDAFEFESTTSKGYALVQSYIEAPSLDEHLRAGRCFNEDYIRHILEAVLETLTYLHTRQPPVIHRDIKPSNILLGDRTGHSLGPVYLVDFGSVQTLAHRGGKTMTVVGTYGYMPPEQFGGTATPASDLYSLGMTTMTLLTQTHPADLMQTDLRSQLAAIADPNLALVMWLERMTRPAIEARCPSAKAALKLLKQSHEIAVYTHPVKKTKLSITPTGLLVDAVGQSIGTGIVFGFICMTVFPGLMVGLWGGISLVFATGALGACCGILIGLINGLVLGLLSYLFHFPLTNLRAHRVTGAIASLISTTLVLLCTCALAIGEGFGMVVFGLVPLTVIGAAIGLVSNQRIDHWYRAPSSGG
ncbi:MAG: serine/threonine-protein kinase [Cyanobacteria bacterium P01_F01_bin.4]